MKIGIIGGGISGLSLGYFLSQREIDFDILEREQVCGGLCRSVQENGFTFDAVGGHIIFSKDQEMVDIMLGLLGSNVVKNRRVTKILYKNRFVKYPFENGLSDLDRQENFECLHGFIKSLASSGKPKNFEEWIYHTFGDGIAEKYMIPYNRKIWNIAPSEMATFWIDGRLPKPPAEDIAKSSLGIETEGYLHQLFFHYPKNGGIQSLTKALEEKVGEKIIRNFPVKKIRKSSSGWVVSDGQEEKSYDVLVSTIHVADLSALLDEVPSGVAEAIKNLRHNSLANVMLGLEGNVSPYHWLYLPDMDIETHRLNFLKNYSPATSPDGFSSLMAEITFNKGDEIDRMGDAELINTIIEKLHKKGLLNKADVCYSRVLRSEYAYVVYDLNYEKNIKIVNDFFHEIGIHLCGRFAEFKYNNMDACMRSAKNLAEKISAW